MPNVFLLKNVYQELPTTIVSHRAAKIRKIVQNMVSVNLKMTVLVNECAMKETNKPSLLCKSLKQ